MTCDWLDKERRSKGILIEIWKTKRQGKNDYRFLGHWSATGFDLRVPIWTLKSNKYFIGQNILKSTYHDGGREFGQAKSIFAWVLTKCFHLGQCYM